MFSEENDKKKIKINLGKISTLFVVPKIETSINQCPFKNIAILTIVLGYNVFLHYFYLPKICIYLLHQIPMFVNEFHVNGDY